MSVRHSTALDLAHLANPPAPASGRLALYAKSDGKVYTKRPAGQEVPHPPVTVSADTDPPPNPAVDDLWIVPDADPVSAAPNIAVSAQEPAFPGPGMWVQTGLGVNGTDFTIWIEDGA